MKWQWLPLLLLCGCAARAPERCAPPCHQWPWQPCCPQKLAACGGPFPTQGTEAVIPDPDYELDLCLLIDIALQNSPNTRITWADARAAAARYGISLADFYPDINGAPYARYSRTSTFFGQGQLITEILAQYGPVISLSYLVFDFGARCARAKAMWEAMQEANWSHNREIQTVMQKVTDSYYTYQGAIGQVEAAEADLMDAQVVLDATVSKRITGVSDLSDELAARTKVAQSELRLLQRQKELEEAIATLTADLGLPANVCIKVEGLPKGLPTADISTSVEEYLRLAYSFRPDLAASKADVASKAQLVKEAKANRLPKLNFDGKASRNYFNSGEVSGIDYRNTLTLHIPLFKGFWYRNKIREAQANLSKSCAQLREKEIKMVEEVVKSYRDFLVATGQVATSEEYVTAAEQSYKSYFMKYLAGTVDFTSVADALAQLGQARASLVLSKEDWYTSLTDLSYATGTISRCDKTDPNTSSAPYGLLQKGRGKISTPTSCQSSRGD